MTKVTAVRRWLRSYRQGFNLLEAAVAVTLLSTLSAGAGVTAVNAKAEYDHSQHKTTLQALVGAITMDAGARASLFNPSLLPLYVEGERNGIEGITSITISPIAQSDAPGEVVATLSDDRTALSLAMRSTKDRCVRVHTVNGVTSAVSGDEDPTCRPLLPEAALSDDMTPIGMAPAELTALQVASGRIQFDWTAVSGAAAYLLTVDPVDAYCAETAPTTSCVLEFPAGTYSAQVDAQNASGFAPTSQTVSFSVSTEPAVPAMSGSGGSAEASLAWVEPANNGSSITSYLVEYQAEGAATWRSVPISDPAVRTLELKPLEAGNYKFRISAENALGFSDVSEPIDVVVAELDAPTIESAEADADGMTLDYTVSDEQDIDAVEYSTDGGATWQPLPTGEDDGLAQAFASASAGQLFLANGPGRGNAPAKVLERQLDLFRKQFLERARNGRAAPLAERLTAPACVSEADLRRAGNSGRSKEARCSIRSASNGSPMEPGVASQVVLRTRLGDVVSPQSAPATAAPLNLPTGLVGYATPSGDGTMEVPGTLGTLSGQTVTFEADGTRIYRITSLLHPQSEEAGEMLQHRIARNGVDIQGSVTDRKHLDLFRTDPVMGYVTRQRQEQRSREETYQSGTETVQVGTKQVFSHRTAIMGTETYPVHTSWNHRHSRTVQRSSNHTHYWTHTHYYSYSCGSRWRPRTCTGSYGHSHSYNHVHYWNETQYYNHTHHETHWKTRTVQTGWKNHYNTVPVFEERPVYSTRTVYYNVTVDYQNWEQVGTKQVKTGTELNTNVMTDSLITFDVPAAGTVTYSTRAMIGVDAGAPNADRTVAPVLVVEDMGPADGMGTVPVDAPAAGVMATRALTTQSNGYSAAGKNVPGQSVTIEAQEGRRYMIISSVRPMSQHSGNIATHQIRRSGEATPLANVRVTLPNRANSANSTIVAYDVPGAGTATYGTHLAFDNGGAGSNTAFADQTHRPLIAVIDVGPADTLPMARVTRFPSGLAVAPTQASQVTVESAGERIYRIDVSADFTSNTRNDRVQLELIRQVGTDEQVIQRSLVVSGRSGVKVTGQFSAIDHPTVDMGDNVVYRVRAVYPENGTGRDLSTTITVDDIGLGTAEAGTLRSVLAPLR